MSTEQDHPLTLYNSLTRQKEPFIPQDASRVTMYNCGPTVYSYAHIGNARAAVVADVLFRVLRHIYGTPENNYEEVVYARNITDVDDKIIAAATEAGVPISEITERYARIYNEDLAALNCLRPTHQPKATEHIQEMADIIVTLMDKDIAYEAEGHILFDVTKDEDYGKLSGRSQDDNRAGARVEVASYKRNAGDFVLWKPAKDGEPGWNQRETSSNYFVDWRNHANKAFAVTPGRPGWHIECSAMAKATLGETIDIHCGGIDLKFPHHENEIAQSECANDKPFSKFWVHNEFLNMGKDKMSKSLGNVTLVHDLLEEWDGEVIRLALLKAHYRSELSWSEDLLRESKAQLDGWYRVKVLIVKCSNYMLDITPYSSSGISTVKEAFWKSLTSDLNLLGVIYELSQNSYEAQIEADRLIDMIVADADEEIDQSASKLWAYWSLVAEYSEILGLLQRDPEDWFRGNASASDSEKFDAIAKRREDARAAKDWAAADAARDEATALGIVLEDGPDGTTWRKA